MKKKTTQSHSSSEENGPKIVNRYSDDELKEFRQIIIEKIEKALADLKEMSARTTNENGTNDTGRSFEVIDQAQELWDRDENQRFINRLERFVQELNLALIRVENKTYGTLPNGKLIPKNRLRICPHAKSTVEEKRQQVVRRRA